MRNKGTRSPVKLGRKYSSQSIAGKQKKSAKAGNTSKALKKPKIISSDRHRLTKREYAVKHLGLDESLMEGVPNVTPRIIRGAGSVDNAIEALRGDESEDAIAFMQKWDSISVGDRKYLTIEEIFTAAGLTAREFVEVVAGALMQQGEDSSRMIVAMAKPKVMESTIKAATDEVPITAFIDGVNVVVGKTNGDVKAMEMFHKITGTLQAPKGSTTNIYANQANQTVVQASNDDGEELPSMDSYMREIQDVVRPQLEASVPSSISTVPINAPEVEYLDAEV
jgi:hypothetical protein